MTTLNHTTVASFLYDFKHLPGRTFCFRCRRSGNMSLPWRAVTSRPWRKRTAVRLCVEYEHEHGSRVFFDFCTDGVLLSLDDGGDVVETTYDMSVVVFSTARNGGISSVDDSQRRLLDDNLRGVFS